MQFVSCVVVIQKNDRRSLSKWHINMYVLSILCVHIFTHIQNFMCGRVNLLPPERTVCLMFMFIRNISKKHRSVEAFMKTGCRLILYKTVSVQILQNIHKKSYIMYNERFHKWCNRIPSRRSREKKSIHTYYMLNAYTCLLEFSFPKKFGRENMPFFLCNCSFWNFPKIEGKKFDPKRDESDKALEQPFASCQYDLA